MKCVLINGTEIKGCTYHIKELFLDELQADELQEFTLPKDGPDFCTGCKQCFMVSEMKCPHRDKAEPIWQAMKEADLIVFAYPVYCLRTPGQVKTLLDHFGVHWFAHRPDPIMFNKRAAIITQSIGAPNGGAQKDVATSMTWWGISDIHKIGFGMMEGVIWDELSSGRRGDIEKKIRVFARKLQGPAKSRRSFKHRLFFAMCRKMQKGMKKKLAAEGKPLTADLRHWMDQGWV